MNYLLIGIGILVAMISGAIAGTLTKLIRKRWSR